jgi:hypothetical protein
MNDISAKHHGKSIAILINDKVLAIPTLLSMGNNSRVWSFSGSFSFEEARKIASGIEANWVKKKP